MKKNIIFSGITRHTDDQISQDGECMELINARVKNGSITPIGKPIQVSTHVHRPIYIHKNGDYENVITLSGEQGVSGTKSFYFGQTLIYNDTTVSYGINHVGNILIIKTDSGIRYFKFETSYFDIGSKPPLPTVIFTMVAEDEENEQGRYADVNPAIAYPTTDNTYFGLEESENNVTNAINGSLLKLYDKAKKNGKFTFPVLARFAYRLYDGSYVYQSAPIHVESGTALFDNTYFGAMRVTVSPHVDSGKLTGIKFNSFCSNFTLKMKVTYYDQSAINSWKDIITGIDVFVSPQFETIDFNGKISEVKKLTGTNIQLDLNFYKRNKLNVNEEDQSLFYKVFTADLKDGEYDIPALDDVSGKDTLPDDEFSHNTLIPEIMYSYNGRLHLANIKTKLFSGHNINQFIYRQMLFNGVPCPLMPIEMGYTEVHIKTESGIAKVYRTHSNEGNAYGISPYLSYPDSRAFKMIICFSQSGTYYRKEFDLKPSSVLNLAYHKSDSIYKLSDFTAGYVAPVSENNIEVSQSKIKVSEISNPFYFPAKNTYTAGNGDILALCSNTAAISQGQFGQYPLYVFTDEGVYAMQVGTNVVYSSASPVSRDVCINKKVTPIDSAVVFATDSGLMAISGSTTQMLSENIDGYLPSAVSDPVIQKILAIPKLSASTTEFKYYLENAEIGYNYQEKEIVISNKEYNYSYVYNLASRQWSKLSLNITSFLNSYPKCLAVVNNTAIFDIHNGHRTINDIALITRPIKFGSMTHKRITQSALRGVVKPSLSELYLRGEAVLLNGDPLTIFKDCGFYVLGSNDCEHYTFISGTEKINDIRDLITKMNKTKAYKYFVFCLVGGVRTDVALNFVEAEVDEAYENRLR